MENHWATENLQTIRVLMERSALYRRALAPIMIVVGGVGIAAAVIGSLIKINSGTFVPFWIGTGFAGCAIALLLIRRQALADAEPFWSSPTRRVAQALLPNFFAGLFAGLLTFIPSFSEVIGLWILAPVWMTFYGCGLHSAGFFTQRSIRLFGWLFLLGGTAVFAASILIADFQTIRVANFVMGASFGGLQALFGLYLFFTEKRKNVA